MAKAMTVIIVVAYLLVTTGSAYDHLMLVLQWPPTACEEQNLACPSFKNKFTIHGLWPQDKSGKSNQCNDTKANVLDKEIGALKPDLIKNWPNLYNPLNNERFWRHEWNAHGRCHFKHQIDYFKLTLGLKDKYDLYKILVAAGLKPGGGNELNTTDISDAISKTVLAKPQLKCYTNTNKESKLWEIRLCVDDKGNGTDCTNDINCKKMIYFPNH